MSEWINVKERLPKHKEHIISVRRSYPAFYHLGFYEGPPREDEDMFEFWMPIPEPPQDMEDYASKSR